MQIHLEVAQCLRVAFDTIELLLVVCGTQIASCFLVKCSIPDERHRLGDVGIDWIHVDASGPLAAKLARVELNE